RRFPAIRPPIADSDVDAPDARNSDPLSGYTAILTDGRRDLYAVVVGSNAVVKNGQVRVLHNDINILVFSPGKFSGKGGIFGDMTLDFGERSGSTAMGTENAYTLNGIVGITGFGTSLYVAAFYDPACKFVIPSAHAGPFPYREMRESEFEALSRRFRAYRDIRTYAAMAEFRSLFEGLFAGTDAACYTPITRADLPESLKGCSIWPDL
ncbi:MAG: hypothetical protein FD164_2370, partial [Nitrospirae bacterium]